jgi:hypothetical protein
MAENNGEGLAKARILTDSGAALRPHGIRNIALFDFKDDRLTLEKMPVDMVISNLYVTLEGHFTPLWDSGTPEEAKEGVLEALIEHFLFEASSKTVIKRTPKALRKVRELINSRGARAWYQVDSQELTQAAKEGGFEFGSSGETIAIRETICLPMGLLLSSMPELTYFDTSRHLQTNLGIKARSFRNLVGGGNAVNFRVNSHNLKVRVWAETSDEDLGKAFSTYRQDYTEEVFLGANRRKKIDIRRDSALMGMMIECYAVDKSTDEIVPINIGEAEGIEVEIKSNGTDEKRAVMSLAQILEQNFIEFDQIDADPSMVYLKLAQGYNADTAEIASLYHSYEMLVTMNGEKLDFADYEYHVRIHFDEIVKL